MGKLILPFGHPVVLPRYSTASALPKTRILDGNDL